MCNGLIVLRLTNQIYKRRQYMLNKLTTTVEYNMKINIV